MSAVITGAHTRTSASDATLRSKPFDRVLVLWLPMIGIVAAAVSSINPRWFTAILIADLWLLGYHHVGATFTKLLGHPDTRRRSVALWTWVPVVVAAATVAVYHFIGIWAITTTYFYWQWFHYTRQSWGIAEAFRRSHPDSEAVASTRYTTAFWAVPVAGLVWRSAQHAPSFLSAPISLVAVPKPVAVGVLVGALALVGAWSFRSPAPGAGATTYFLTHATIFAVAYVIAPTISIGWLAINIWHNGQYLAFVWHTNTKLHARPNLPNAEAAPSAASFGREMSPMAWLSQPQRWPIYTATVLAVTSVAYLAVGRIGGFATAATPLVFMGLNFHHYLVDGVIWKSRRARSAPVANGAAVALRP